MKGLMHIDVLPKEPISGRLMAPLSASCYRRLLQAPWWSSTPRRCPSRSTSSPRTQCGCCLWEAHLACIANAYMFA